MLIVNADDLGRNQFATDKAITIYNKGRITSTSAMVFMEDSVRAADIANSSGIDVGLHINLYEDFTSDAVPTRLREYHGRICQFLGNSKFSLLLYNPFLRSQFRYVFQAQYDEFIRLYDRLPSHMDGHHHKHLASNMLIDQIIPCGTKVRRNFTFNKNEKSLWNRAYRRIVDSWLKRRYHITDYLFGMKMHDAAFLERVIRLAQSSNVELIVHPDVSEEYDYLMSDTFAQAIYRVRLGNYNSI